MKSDDHAVEARRDDTDSDTHTGTNPDILAPDGELFPSLLPTDDSSLDALLKETLPESPPPPDLWSRIESSLPSTPPPPAPWSFRVQEWLRSRPLVWAPLPAAAIVVLALFVQPPAQGPQATEQPALNSTISPPQAPASRPATHLSPIRHPTGSTARWDHLERSFRAYTRKLRSRSGRG